MEIIWKSAVSFLFLTASFLLCRRFLFCRWFFLRRWFFLGCCFFLGRFFLIGLARSAAHKITTEKWHRRINILFSLHLNYL